MKKKNIISNTMLLATACLALASCSDWDDHYKPTQEGATTTLNLYEALCNEPNTTEFAKILAQTGYDKVLSSSQTYTVFAPTNEDLAGFDASNEEAALRLATNHIARYSAPTSTSVENGVKMQNGKIYHFDNSTSFQGCHIEDANERTANGIIHRIKGQIPYAYNIYEYIKENGNFSKLYDFIHQFDETKFDEDNSTEIDIDQNGRPIYDSIMVSYNRLLEDKKYGLGHIAKEDSIYTMLLPDNQAWDAAYQRISPYYKVYDADGKGDSLQDVRTKLAIVSDLIYDGKLGNPALSDSLVSSTGSVIHHPANLFGNAEKHDASNGLIYAVGSLAYDNTETWNKPVSVEGEEQKGRNYNNTTTSVYARTIKAESLIKQISGDSYIEVQPNTSATNPTVQFEIPNVLAGKYNIYAVILPATVDGEEAELDSTILSFTLYYKNANGRVVNKKNTSKKLITNSREVTKMLAFPAFEFPVSDYTDNLWLSDENNQEEDIKTSTSLSISTNVTTKEYSTKKYSRTFRLDRIILEPIKN